MVALKALIKVYDVTNAFVVLEGKNSVLPPDADKLVKPGRLPAIPTSNITFRSGNLAG
jgi:hypothetical protein